MSTENRRSVVLRMTRFNSGINRAVSVLGSLKFETKKISILFFKLNVVFYSMNSMLIYEETIIP